MGIMAWSVSVSCMQHLRLHCCFWPASGCLCRAGIYISGLACNTVDDQKLPTMDKESSPSSNKLDAMADLSKLIVMYDTSTSIHECLLLQAAFGVFWHWR